MEYSHVISGVFVRRLNRFVAHCIIDGREIACHIKNTGRLQELLIPGCKVYLQYLPSPNRKTQYDIIAVEKNGRLFNIDSTAPNKAAAEWLPTFLNAQAQIRPEYTFGDSRIDFYAQTKDQKILLEVKGVTLVRDTLSLFPDAPTERGIRHLKELTKAVSLGYTCYALFVIQTACPCAFTPNKEMDPAFSEALIKAHRSGVHILAYTCLVTPSSMVIDRSVPVILS